MHSKSAHLTAKIGSLRLLRAEIHRLTVVCIVIVSGTAPFVLTGQAAAYSAAEIEAAQTPEATATEAPLPHYVDTPFCSSRTLRAFEDPLESLPTLHGRPNGKLPFASTGIVFSKETSEVVVGDQAIQYQFRFERRGPPGLELSVRSRLNRINSKGEFLRVVRQKRERVKLNQAKRLRNIGFKHSPDPGLYRYDLIFRRNGRTVGRLHDYYRVVHKSLKVHLRLNGKVFRPGDRILGQIENYTAESVDTTTHFEIQRYEHDGWVTVPSQDIFGYPVKFRSQMILAYAGTAGRCSAVMVVLPTMSPGRYRMLKPINVFWKEAGRRSPRRITAEFIVAIRREAVGG
jgi:hypothetical protein